MPKVILLLMTAIAFSCSTPHPEGENAQEVSTLRAKVDSLSHIIAGTSSQPKGPLSTFLTFQGYHAEEAMNFYIGLFENSRITDVQRYGKEGPAKEGSIMMATFELNGSAFACSDSYIEHEWNFTPGVSIWVECQSEDEIETLLAKLSKNGAVLMPLDNYGFSTKFAFVEDQFGVSWQLNLGKVKMQ